MWQLAVEEEERQRVAAEQQEERQRVAAAQVKAEEEARQTAAAEEEEEEERQRVAAAQVKAEEEARQAMEKQIAAKGDIRSETGQPKVNEEITQTDQEEKMQHPAAETRIGLEEVRCGSSDIVHLVHDGIV